VTPAVAAFTTITQAGESGGRDQMATVTGRNGVDVDRLVATVGAVQGDPNVAQFTFRARSSWETGGRNRGTIQEFEHAGATSTERPAPFELVGD